MIADQCDWSVPGRDSYQGTTAAAIAAYGFPIATQQALIEAFEKRDFTDVVIVDRDSVRGSHDWEPDLRGMHFGRNGRICATVNRSMWDAGHTESAIVVCAHGECVGVFSVCRNWTRFTRRSGGSRPERPALGLGGPEPLPPVEATFESVYASYTPPSDGVPGWPSVVPPAWDGPGWGWVPHGGTWGHVVRPEPPVSPPVIGEPPQVIPPIPAIPEPSTYLLMVGGLGLVGWLAKRRKA